MTQALSDGELEVEWVEENKWLRVAPYASSDDTERESDAEDPDARPAPVDPSSPPQAADEAIPKKPENSKAGKALVAHPPDYRTKEVGTI